MGRSHRTSADVRERVARRVACEARGASEQGWKGGIKPQAPAAAAGSAQPAPSWDNDATRNATINVDAALNERLAVLASQAGERVDEFVGAQTELSTLATIAICDATVLDRRCVAGRH